MPNLDQFLVELGTSHTADSLTNYLNSTENNEEIEDAIAKSSVKYVHAYYALKPPYVLREYSPLFGVEWEIENYIPTIELKEKLFSGSSPWTATTDHSLRNNGVELLFRGPCGFIDTIKTMRATYEILHEKTNVEFSHRTSIHVHNCVAMKTLDELYKYIFLYFVMEPELFKLAGRNRQFNNFCVPLQALGPHGLCNTRFAEIPKYAALGSFKMSTQMTLEWRHLPGNASIETIDQWLHTINNLDLYTFKTDENSPEYSLKLFLKVCTKTPEYLCTLIEQLSGFRFTSEFVLERIMKFHVFSNGEFA